jgi:hypothetical protein
MVRRDLLTIADEPLYAKTLRQLREMSDDEVVEAHDALDASERSVVHLAYYMDELARAETRIGRRKRWSV